MVRGAPDYSNVKSEQAIYTLMDLGELAARLGSIDVFDRSGNLVWMDDFEAATLNWETIIAGTGAAVALSTAQRLRGAQSCLLTCPSDAGLNVMIDRWLAMLHQSTTSFEIAFAPDANITTFDIHLTVFNSGIRYSNQIRWDGVAKTISYFNAASAWTVFAIGVDLMTLYTGFNCAKLTVDLATGNYKRFRLNQTIYDLSGIAPAAAPVPHTPNLLLLVEVTGTIATNALCYVDNVLVKQNEP